MSITQLCHVSDVSRHFRLLDQLSVSVTLNRAFDFADPSLPKIKVNLQVPSVDFKLSDLYLQDLLGFAASVSKTVVVAKAEYSSRQSEALAMSRLPSVASLADLASLSELTASVLDHDAEVFYDAEEDPDLMTHPLGRNPSIRIHNANKAKEHPRRDLIFESSIFKFSGSFVVRQICFHFQKQQEFSEPPFDFLVLKIQNLELAATAYQLDTRVLFSMQQLQLLHVFDGTFIPLVVAGPNKDQLETQSSDTHALVAQTDSEISANNASAFSIVICRPEHPDFAARFDSIETKIALQFAAIRLSTYHSSMLDLLLYFSTLTKNLAPVLQSFKQQKVNQPPTTNPLSQHQVVHAALNASRKRRISANCVKIAMSICLDNLYLGIHISDQFSLAAVQVAGLRLDSVEMSTGDKRIDLSLQQFNLHDLTPQRGFYGLVASLEHQTPSKISISIPSDHSLPLSIEWKSGSC
jgi:hypothetical protein